jgi:hypothetical protein
MGVFPGGEAVLPKKARLDHHYRDDPSGVRVAGDSFDPAARDHGNGNQKA